MVQHLATSSHLIKTHSRDLTSVLPETMESRVLPQALSSPATFSELLAPKTRLQPAHLWAIHSHQTNLLSSGIHLEGPLSLKTPLLLIDLLLGRFLKHPHSLQQLQALKTPTTCCFSCLWNQKQSCQQKEKPQRPKPLPNKMRVGQTLPITRPSSLRANPTQRPPTALPKAPILLFLT